jgi:hypothetical protein
MRTFNFSISLRISSKSIDPLEISDKLNLRPKWLHKIGEARRTPKGRQLDGFYESSYCSFQLNIKNNEGLYNAIDGAADLFSPYKDLFHRIRNDGGRVEFFVGWFSENNTGEILDFALLGKLHELQIDLALDIYGGAGEQRRLKSAKL